MQELHFRESINWPDGYGMAVLLTFDFQGGEDVKPDRNGRINHEEWTQGEYGPQTGIWRILRILDETGVKGRFLTCGAIAERYPEAVKAIAQRGHEIAGHGYHHGGRTRPHPRRRARGHAQDNRDDREAGRQATHWVALLYAESQ